MLLSYNTCPPKIIAAVSRLGEMHLHVALQVGVRRALRRQQNRGLKAVKSDERQCKGSAKAVQRQCKGSVATASDPAHEPKRCHVGRVDRGLVVSLVPIAVLR